MDACYLALNWMRCEFVFGLWYDGLVRSEASVWDFWSCLLLHIFYTSSLRVLRGRNGR